MSSSIGDVVNNPAIQNRQSSLLARGLQGFNRGVASLPDLASNLLSMGGGYLRPTEGHHEPLWQMNPIENLFEQTGIVNPNMPSAQTYGDKVAEKGGEILGGMALPLGGAAKGTAEGAGAVSKWLANALLGKNTGSTIGSMAAPALAAPAIEDYTKDPLTRAGLEFGTSVLGGGAGSSLSKLADSLMGKTPSTALPEYTAAQNSYMSDPDASKTKDLIARQLDLAKKDPKSADLLDQIGKNQEEKIIGNLTPENPIGGDEITSKIKDYTNDLIAKRGSEYQTEKANIMANPQAVDPNPTLSLIDKIQSEAAIGSPLEGALAKARQLIVDNSGDPNKVMKAKTALQNMAKYSPDLHLDNETDAVMKQIASQFGNDIDKAMPGYAAMNQNYSDKTKNLQGIINGLGGKIAAAGETAPASVPRKIFEKVDPDLSPQLQKILPQDTYGQAADSYLGDVLQRAQTTPSKNVYNDATQTYKIGDILNKNYNTLQSTLPPEQMAKVDQALNDINVTMLGRPRNDYTIQSRRNVSVGDEIKGLGNNINSLPLTSNPLTWMNAPSIIANKLSNPLQRNEMLTGVSPTGQIANAVGNQAIKAAAIDAMNQPPLTPAPASQTPLPSQNNQTSQPPQATGQPNTPQNTQTPSAIDQVMQKYGLGNTPQGKVNPQTQNQQNNQPSSAIDQVMQKYGLSTDVNSAPQNSLANQPTAAENGHPLTSDALDFLTRQLKSGNKSALYDPDKAYSDYQGQQSQMPYYEQDGFKKKVKDIIASKESRGSGDYSAEAPNSSAAGRYQFLDATREKMLPDVSREDFLDNPDLQETAMDNLMQSNINDFKNAGIDPNSVNPSNLAGMLMAAHLRGSRAGVNAYNDPDYQGIPDANGTLPRSYYDYARNAFSQT